MKRDMDLVRKILLEIEERYVSTALYDLQIEGYDVQTIANHCKIMQEAGLFSACSIKYASNDIYAFGVGGLTWNGYDYLDKIRDDSVWRKTKDVITEKGLPLVFDTIKTISTAFITAAAEGVANSILNNKP